MNSVEILKGIAHIRCIAVKSAARQSAKTETKSATLSHLLGNGPIGKIGTDDELDFFQSCTFLKLPRKLASYHYFCQGSRYISQRQNPRHFSQLTCLGFVPCPPLPRCVFCLIWQRAVYNLNDPVSIWTCDLGGASLTPACPPRQHSFSSPCNKNQ